MSYYNQYVLFRGFLMLNILTSFSLIFFIFFAGRFAYGNVIVSMEVQQGADNINDVDNVYVELFDTVAPMYVTNFLKYINNTTTNGGNYEKSFIHRVGLGSVLIQGGGYSFDPANGSFVNNPAVNNFPGGLQKITADPQVDNEFGLSNLRGTISMAKLMNQPNSATNEWFINIADNTFLDTQNSGFTVFGNIVADGMAVLDEVAGQTTFPLGSIHAAFGEIPLINYTAGDPVLQDNLVRVNGITEHVSFTTDASFINVVLGETQQVKITLQNKDVVDLQIGNIGDTDSLFAPFVLVSENCSNTVLVIMAQCVITINFTPFFENTYDDTFNIEFTNLVLSYTYSINATGVAVIGANIVVSALNIDFGEVSLSDLPNEGIQIDLGVQNQGNVDLDFISTRLTGTDVALFSINDECAAGGALNTIEICVINIFFKPITDGLKNVVLEIETNDPDQAIVAIPITGSGSLDGDGVIALIEDAAPNSGDGNSDGVLDSLQSHILSSVVLGNDNYVTFVALEEHKFKNFLLFDETQIAPPPSGINLTGAYELDLIDLPITSGIFATDIGLILPKGVVPESFYIYGPTADDSNPHWYEFLFDGQTGAQLIGDAELETASGKKITKSIIKLVFVDGARGDNDLTVNQVISFQGSHISSEKKAGSGSSAVNLYYILLFMALILYLRAVVNLPALRAFSASR